MLKELQIKNFALIDQLTISFDPRLNILTGETGAGKTILINALNLLLGGRATAEFIRSGADSAEVEAAFILEKDHPVYSLIEDAGYSLRQEEEIIIRRVIFRSERANRCYLNSHLVPLGLLVTIGAWMIDIHGQHEHQILLNQARHLEILDRFGKLEPLVDEVTSVYREYQEEKGKWEGLVKRREETKKEHDLLSFQREEIDQARLREGEEEELLGQRTILANAARIKELAALCNNSLYQSENSLYEGVGEVLSKVRELATLDKRFEALGDTITSLQIQLEDIATQLRNYTNEEELSPQSLEEIEERLHLINRMKKKYQRSLAEILQLRAEMEIRWALIEDYDGEIQRAHAGMKKRYDVLAEKASLLSTKRKAVAQRIEREIGQQLTELKMEHARFLVRFSNRSSPDGSPHQSITAKGWDDVEFLFSANLGEEPKALARIASGGEISRVMLAFKSCLASADQVLTLVFDEIDSGIGGETAIVVGQKIKQLAKKRQVMCITHLPQIASHANTHYLVSKKIEGGRTLSIVTSLSRNEQIEELAKMIAGDKRSETALRHATEILNKSADLMEEDIREYK